MATNEEIRKMKEELFKHMDETSKMYEDLGKKIETAHDDVYQELMSKLEK